MLHGLKAVLILSVTAAILAALSKSGVPPLLGFLSKEYMYKSGLEVSITLTTIFLLVNVTMVALALALIVKPFFATYEGNPTPAEKVEANKGLWMPPMLLAIASVLAPLFGLGGSTTMWLFRVFCRAYPTPHQRQPSCGRA